ncbi:MAG TPA: hypothetical protein VFK24_10845 [Gammaproteobacteria bacterium]|nr:hypothetical protein [Gammaproteobacteria bacterium]
MKYIIPLLVVLACCSTLSVAHAGEPRQTSVQLKTTTGVLYGTLELPAGKAPWPVALIIAGSGPTDRNGNSPIGLTTDAYKLLASALAGRGIATLRYDKRGIAQSAPTGPSESKLRFTTYIDDAVAWGKLLAAERVR